MRIKTNVAYTQAKNCSLCLHVGSIAIMIGKGKLFRKRLELFTPMQKFRWSSI
jgi:hypothetical protein